MISVIVPVFNTEKYLRRCINSILAQTYTDFELILIDDGSTDNSGLLCDEYAETDNRIVVFHEDNKGQAVARNVGLDYVFEKENSEWIAFVDSDDCINSRYLEVLLSYAVSNNVQISVCGYTEKEDLFLKERKSIDLSKVWNTEDFFCEHTMQSVILWSKLFSKECFRNERIQDLRMYEDSYTMLRVLFACPNVSYCDVPLYYYCQSENSVMRSEWTPERLSSLEFYKNRATFFKEKGLKNAFNRNVLSYIYDLNNQIEICEALPKYNSELMRMRRMLKAFLIKNRKTVKRMLPDKGKYLKNAFPNAYRLYCFLKKILKFTRLRLLYRLNILNARNTINRIVKYNMSISRFGDGELGIMFSDRSIGFQDSSKELKDELIKAFSNKNKDLLICVPRALNTTRGRKKYNRNFWIIWGINGNQQKLKKMIEEIYPNGYKFGDAQITRSYISFKSSKNAKRIFPLLKKIWNNRDLLIVEGSNTCLGVGNDLFSDAASIKRIIAPNKNAFNYLDRIIDAVTDIYNGELVLIALGPTATVLASKLCDKGIQSLDIGHVDLEYVWYLQKAKEIVCIENRYVNEATSQTPIEECNDVLYQKEIIKRIEF